MAESDSASVKCTYKITYQPDSTNIGSKNTESAFLLIGKTLSLYQYENKIKLDSAIDNNIRNNIQETKISNYPKANFWYRIYKKSSENQVTTIDYIGTKEYAYTETMPLFVWNISSESKNINGYNCRRATTSYAGRVWEAWYTTEIPFSEGPHKFSGLPGLILEIKDVKGYYEFKMSDITFKQNSLINFSNAGISYTTRNDFRKNKDNYEKNYVSIRIAQGGAIYGDEKTMRKIVSDNYNKRNNPIELK
ncbi:GLPGLI family protein [Hymenobacter piscis]|uniref:GLPGLI family protein n=1 Tax=Hymenobacter piscis TaxID=2839984 RepID=UPI001FE8CF56